MPVLKSSNEVNILPDLYFKDQANYWELWAVLIKNFSDSSRTLPDALTRTISDMLTTDVRIKPHIPHWHQISGDDDARSLRNLLQSDGLGYPKRQSRNIDLLRYIDMCLQYKDLEYRQYVASWCLDQIFDEDDDT